MKHTVQGCAVPLVPGTQISCLKAGKYPEKFLGAVTMC